MLSKKDNPSLKKVRKVSAVLRENYVQLLFFGRINGLSEMSRLSSPPPPHLTPTSPQTKWAAN